MNSNLQHNFELFKVNREAMKKAFKWQGEELSMLGASMLSIQGIQTNLEQLKEMEAILKKQESIFSSFRSGHIKTAIVAKMVQSKEPERYLIELRSVKDKLEDGAFFTSEYTALAAIILLDRKESDDSFDLEASIQETLRIYKEIDKVHPILTNKEDLPFIALLAISDIDHTILIDRCETCMKAIKEKMGFWTSDTSQSIGFILALSNHSTEQKCQYVYDVYQKCKENGIRFGRSTEMCVIAAGELVEIPIQTFVDDMTQIHGELKEALGFDRFFISTEQKTLYAALLVLTDYLPKDSSLESAILVSTIIQIVLQEMAAVSVASTVAIANHN